MPRISRLAFAGALLFTALAVHPQPLVAQPQLAYRQFLLDGLLTTVEVKAVYAEMKRRYLIGEPPLEPEFTLPDNHFATFIDPFKGYDANVDGCTLTIGELAAPVDTQRGWDGSPIGQQQPRTRRFVYDLREAHAQELLLKNSGQQSAIAIRPLTRDTGRRSLGTAPQPRAFAVSLPVRQIVMVESRGEWVVQERGGVLEFVVDGRKYGREQVVNAIKAILETCR